MLDKQFYMILLMKKLALFGRYQNRFLAIHKVLALFLKDLFSVLGRDPEQIEQLDGVNFLVYGLELLEAAFHRDPLNPDSWWDKY